MMNLKCMNCGAAALRRFIDLGEQPNGNHVLSESEIKSELRFSFAMAVCTDCWQVQIEEFPPMELMFSNHPYITGVNMPVVDHFFKLVDHTIFRWDIKEHSLVLDIGANDGTLLKLFQQRGMRVLGVDPGKRTGALCRANGISVCETFWDLESARAFKRLNLKPDLITATAVFYHVPSLHDFIAGLREVMGAQTIFLAQCVYLKDVLERVQFDHFYHEHTMIHAIAPLQRVFAQHGMKLLHVDYYDVHGGSFALHVALEESDYRPTAAVAKAISVEQAAGLNQLDTYLEFSKRVEQNREDLVALLKKLKKQGKSIYALGAPLKGSTLLNYCKIGPDLVTLATEVNTFKIGRLIPGVHIPIVDERTLRSQPDYYLLLAWNFLEYFSTKYAAFLKNGGRFILPHPSVVCYPE